MADACGYIGGPLRQRQRTIALPRANRTNMLSGVPFWDEHIPPSHLAGVPFWGEHTPAVIFYASGNPGLAL